MARSCSTPCPRSPTTTRSSSPILERWEREGTFGQLRAQNADGPRFSFIDGPVTANKSLAVHTAWGRTLKDVFQRYKALQGYHQRYQNGFDCQGLWIEVGVEKELGLNSKREIEEYGLEAFAQRCRAVVERSAGRADRGLHPARAVDGLGQRLLHVLRHEHRVHLAVPAHRPRSGLALPGPPRHGVVPPVRHVDLGPRAGGRATSTASTRRCRCASRSSTAPARPSSSGRPRRGRCRPTSPSPCSRPPATAGWPTATGSASSAAATPPSRRRSSGASSSAGATRGPSTTSARAETVAHRVIGWDDVALDEGTGLVHIAPGCGTEDFELSKVEDLPVLMPVDESGRFVPAYGWLAGRAAHDVAGEVIADLRSRGPARRGGRDHPPLPRVLALPHAADLPHLRRLVHLRRRDPRTRCARPTPRSSGRPSTWASGWTTGSSTWATGTSRGGATTACRCRSTPARAATSRWSGSKADLARLATAPLDDLAELRRPWIDRVAIRCPGVRRGGAAHHRGRRRLARRRASSRSPPSGGRTRSGSTRATPPARPRASPPPTSPTTPTGTSGSRPTGCRRCASRSASGSTRSCFMSVALTGRAPFRKVLGYEKMLDEQGQEMHGSWGNMIDAPEAFARMGADVMRWQYSAQPPTQNLLFGFGPGFEIQRKLLTLVEQRQLLHPVRQHRRVHPRPGGAGDRARRRPRAPRPLAGRADPPAGGRHDRRLRAVPVGQRAAGLRAVRGRRLQLVRAPVAPPVLERRRGGPAHAVELARRGPAGGGPDHAVPHRAPVAPPGGRPAPDCAARRSSWPAGRPCTRSTTSSSTTRPPCARSSSWAARRGPRRSSRSASRCGASSSRAATGPPATPPTSPRSCASRRSPSGRSRPPSCGCGPTSPCSGPRFGKELGADPPGPRGRRARAARRRSVPRGRPRARPRRRPRRAHGQARLGGRQHRRRVGRPRHRARRRPPPRGPGVRPHPPDQLHAQGRRASSSPTASGSALPTSCDDLLDHAEWIATETLAVAVGLSADEELRIETGLTDELWFEGGMGILPHPFGGSGLREGRQHTPMAPTKKASAQKAPAKKAVGREEGGAGQEGPGRRSGAAAKSTPAKAAPTKAAPTKAAPATAAPAKAARPRRPRPGS